MKQPPNLSSVGRNLFLMRSATALRYSSGRGELPPPEAFQTHGRLPPKAAAERTSVDVSKVPTAVIGRPAAPRFAER